MSSRDVVRMSDDEVSAFLAAHLKVQVAATSATGFPHLTTLFYALDDHGRITFWTYGASQKIVNLRRDDRVAALVESGTDYDELRGVSITGHAEIVTDHDAILSIGKAVAARMLGVDDFDALGELAAAGVEKQARKRVGVVIHPQHVASWDHQKMKG